MVHHQLLTVSVYISGSRQSCDISDCVMYNVSCIMCYVLMYYVLYYYVCITVVVGAFDYGEGTVDDTTPSGSGAGQLVVHSVAFSHLLGIFYVLINSLMI